MNLVESVVTFFTTNIRDKDKPIKNSIKTQENSSIQSIPVQVENEEIINATLTNQFDFWSSNIGISSIDSANLIRRWRMLAAFPEAQFCLNEIVNGSISMSDEDEVTSIDCSGIENLYEINSAAPMINEINKSFEKFLLLTNWEENCDSLYRQFLVDGCIRFESVFPKDRKELKEKGIIDLVQLSPIGMKKIKIRNVGIENEAEFVRANKDYITSNDANQIYDEIEPTKKEYDPNKEYVFYTFDKSAITNLEDGYKNPYQTSGSGFSDQKNAGDNFIIFDEEAIVECNSQRFDTARNLYLSEINSAVSAIGKYNSIQDSLVISRISRSFAKRKYIVNTRGMNNKTATAYINGMKDRFTQRKTYDSSLGEIRENKSSISISDDYWISQGSDGIPSVDIQNLEGTGDKFDVIDDLNFFYDLILKAFGVPTDRKQVDNSTNIGFSESAATVETANLRFFKRCMNLRGRFSQLIYEFLKRDLIARRIIGIDDFQIIKKYIKLIWNSENDMARIKKFQLLNEQIALLDRVEPYHEKGLYFSRAWIEREILGRNLEEIDQIKSEFEDEAIEADKTKESQLNQLSQGEGGFGDEFPEPSSQGSAFSTGFSPIPSQGGNISQDAFGSFGAEEPPENEPESATPPTEPENLNQSIIQSKSKDQIILEAFEKYSYLEDGSKLEIFGNEYIKESGIFIKL